jgi:hypothetical protein
MKFNYLTSIILLSLTVNGYQVLATGKQNRKAHKSSCTAEIKGADRNIEIPAELCFDPKRPVEASEGLPNPPDGQKQANTLYQMKVPRREVPPEVLRVIEIIIGKKLTAKEFWLVASSNGEYLVRSKRATPTYIYSPMTDGQRPSEFRFQKQKGKLRLTLAEI